MKTERRTTSKHPDISPAPLSSSSSGLSTSTHTKIDALAQLIDEQAGGCGEIIVRMYERGTHEVEVRFAVSL